MAIRFDDIGDRLRAFRLASGMNALLYAPATQRNREPILGVLRRVLPAGGAVLEIGRASCRERV